MRRIRFAFDVNKFADVMVYLAPRVPDFTTLKATKLLYLADRTHLQQHARPILGDWYACMKDGPVPSQAYTLLKGLRDGDASGALPGLEILCQHLAVREVGREYPIHAARSSAGDPAALSASKIEVLDEIVKRYGQKSAGQLRNLTHQHAAWKDCDEQEMDYRKFFDGAPAAARAMLELPAARGA